MCCCPVPELRHSWPNEHGDPIQQRGEAGLRPPGEPEAEDRPAVSGAQDRPHHEEPGPERRELRAFVPRDISLEQCHEAERGVDQWVYSNEGTKSDTTIWLTADVATTFCRSVPPIRRPGLHLQSLGRDPHRPLELLVRKGDVLPRDGRAMDDGA